MKLNLRKHKILATHKLKLRERLSSGFQFGVILVLGNLGLGLGLIE